MRSARDNYDACKMVMNVKIDEKLVFFYPIIGLCGIF